MKERKSLRKKDAKVIAKAQEEGKSAPSSSAKGPKKKKSTVAQLEATPCPPAKAALVGDHWEIIPHASPKLSVPAMPKVAARATEMHRPALRELVKEKIRELEFKVAIELFASVARLVSKKKLHGIPKQKPLSTKNGTISGTRVFGVKSVSMNVVT